ncbi:alpha-amylase family protein [Nocardioides sp. CFH 31398]|uniref:alpha-amylase family protein n=1 Tax=Nocardioides sp. CFH 31398 TaxID=2919579 RepID=UPI001F0643CC|nr:alpha-amylase family protein [Nocardioides sp. CFH 31398]MCH1867111.1 alpha-amylase family protein [Nocardioides sp. CFH 31398]
MTGQDLAASLTTYAASLLTALTPERREAFLLRVERWAPDLLEGLAVFDDEAVRRGTAERLVGVAARAYAARPDDLHTLDARRLLRPGWVQDPGMFGYACYTDRFAGDLAGLERRADHLERLGVSYLHLMPLLEPREGDNDGGYAVKDYRRVRPDLGDRDDLRAVTTMLRGRGISLCVDLVLNHVAREHAWAAAARAGDPEYRDYFHVFDDRTVPDAYEATLPEVFPDFAPGSFTFDDELAGWVWTTFNAWQWDLDWSNPAVLVEFADVVCDLANLGVEVVRLDAVAFLWKRMGTSCQNQPEVHQLVQALRATTRMAAPAVLFKAEAIVGPRDLVAYLGGSEGGRHVGRVSDLAYHNSLMVQVWSMLATGETRLARHALRALPPTPPGGTWITYVRCHDDIGWAVDDGDAAAVGVTGEGHRRFLSDWYAGEFAGSWADGLVFQANPATGDRRISGTAASLCGIDADPGAAVARVLLAHTIVAGYGGVPVVWSGDELALPNDQHWAEEPGHEADNRWAHRPRVTDDHLPPAPGSAADRVLGGLSHLARVRASLPSLHASLDPEVLDDGLDDGVLGLLRRHWSGTVVGLHNVTAAPRPVALSLLADLGLATPYDVLGEAPLTADADGLAWLPPYGAWWVVDR